MRLLGVAFVTALLSFSGLAAAAPQGHATLTAVKGEVFVDIGDGFTPVTGAFANLKPGDRVMVAKNGSAVLNLGPNCSVPLAAPSMTTVEEAACVVGTEGGGGGGKGILALMTGGQLAASFATLANGIGDEAPPMSP